MNLFVKRLIDLREAGNLSQKQVASYTGISPRMISLYESGTNNPPIDKVIKLANFFEVTIDYLLGIDKQICHSKIMIQGDTNKQMNGNISGDANVCYNNDVISEDKINSYGTNKNPNKKARLKAMQKQLNKLIDEILEEES